MKQDENKFLPTVTYTKILQDLHIRVLSRSLRSMDKRKKQASEDELITLKKSSDELY